jgi:uncharacterized protein YndB with AHSA1/START domain
MISFQTGSLKVKRPVDEVFAYLTDVDKQAEWSNAVLESHREGFGQVGKGTRYHTKIRILGRLVEGVAEVSDYQPNRRIEFTNLTGPMPYTWDVVVEASDGATLLTGHGQAEPVGVFKIAAPVIRGAMKRQAENDFRTLKTILEEGS